MKPFLIRRPCRSQGSALLIVLALLLLLTTLTVAFFSRATFERQLSNASFSQAKVDLASQGAIGAIIGDLQKEIVAGSNTTTLASGFYYPNSPLTVIPAVVGFTPAAGVENLLKISQRGTSFWPSANYTAAGPIRASSVSSLTPSLNGRLISNARWNAPLLMNPINAVATPSDFTPPAAFTGNPPDWIYIARDGSNPSGTTLDSSYIYSANVSPTATPAAGNLGTNPVMQRYAYAIYDEGSTLDMNVAGSPISTTGTFASGSSTAGSYSIIQGYKSTLAYADLLQLPYNASTTATLSSTLNAAEKEAFVNAIVGWRNYASSGLSSTGGYLFPNVFPFSYSVSANSASAGTVANYDYNVLFNTSGFLAATGTALVKGPSLIGTANQSDNILGSRQQLLQLILQGLGQNNTFLTNSGLTLSSLETILPYLGTFSRDVSQPSYAPDPNRPVVLAQSSGGNDMAGYANTAANQNLINPAFLNVAATSGFTRNDGSTALIGEPLVKKRFALMRLAWLTYKGPSANRTQYAFGSTSPGTASADYDMWALVNIYGVPASLLAQGTNPNIEAYFGLNWVTDSSTSIGINDGTLKWKYEHGTNQTTPGVMTSGSPGRIMTLAQVQSVGRDPDFFELLKAAVTVGAIAKPGTPSGSLVTPAGYQNAKDSSVDAYIIQLGANIIAQSNVASYCPRIIFDDGTWLRAGADVPQEYRGVEDLPYLYRMRGTHIKITESNPAENTTNETATGPSYAQGFTPSTTGSGEFLQIPEIFNPHNWNTSVTPVLKPASFQLIPLSADPMSVNAGAPTALGTTQTLAWSNNNNGNTGVGGDTVGNPGEPPAFTINGEAITFTIPASTTGAGFFREPTLLNKPDPGSISFFGPPVGSAVAATGSSSQFSNAQITSWYKANCYTNNSSAPSCIIPNSTAYDNQLYLGFNFGVVPLWFPWPSTTTITTTTPMVMTSAVTVGGNLNFTYQLQYPDPNTPGKWDTYDEKFLPLSICGPWGGGYGMNSPLNTFLMGTQGTANFNQGAAGTGGSGAPSWGYYDLIEMDNYLVVADPRTARFSASLFTAGQTAASYAPPPYQYSEGETRWVDVSQNALTSTRPDFNAGWDVIGNPGSSLGFYNPGISNYAGYAPFFAQNWASNPDYSNLGLCVGDGQSTFGSSNAPQYYADPDGVVRRGSAAYSNAPGSPASTSVPPTAYNGLPLQTSTTYAKSGSSVTATPITYSSRPIVLNRPFRSVAELGYTFSGTPGKNIDFATPESGYAALLDLFCINDTNDPNGLVAGKVDLNTRQSAVLNAVLAGAYKDEYYQTYATNPGISPADAALMATSATYGLISRTTSTTSPYGPLRNVSELVGKYVSDSTISGAAPTAYDGSLSYSGFSGDLNSIATTDASSPNRNLVQRFHEASIRALANCGTTRVWNLMIDVIAQTGRFPSSASTLANFNVEGERRYWVHVAIDRYTGKVLDEQVEEVKE